MLKLNETYFEKLQRKNILRIIFYSDDSKLKSLFFLMNPYQQSISKFYLNYSGITIF